jgi:hypothetical protein
MRQVLANRENGLKGGVKTPEGKAISRLNARRHSIFTSAVTPEDSEDLYVLEDQLIATLRPVGRVEEMLAEKLALTYLRMQRCARAEAEYHIRTWEEPNPLLEEFAWEQLKRKGRCGARAVPFKDDVFTRMVGLIDLYDARLTNQFLKILHEIERQQRLRAGENVPPPVVAELTIQADPGTARALLEEAPAPAQEKSQDADGQQDNAQKTI